MTVIAYNKGVMYADRLHHLETGSRLERKHLKDKIHINPERTIAFCSTGLEVNPGSLEALFLVLYRILELNENIEGVQTSNRFANDDDINVLLRLNARAYLVMTKNKALYIRECGTIILDADDLVTDGSDGAFFKALCLAGMKPAEIIPHIHNHLSSQVSIVFDMVKQKDLKPLRFINSVLDEPKIIERVKKVIKEAGGMK